jgi:hypothetical protein
MEIEQMEFYDSDAEISEAKNIQTKAAQTAALHRSLSTGSII